MFHTLLSVKRLHFVSLLKPFFVLLAELLTYVSIVTPFDAVVNYFLNLFVVFGRQTFYKVFSNDDSIVLLFS